MKQIEYVCNNMEEILTAARKLGGGIAIVSSIKEHPRIYGASFTALTDDLLKEKIQRSLYRWWPSQGNDRPLEDLWPLIVRKP